MINFGGPKILKPSVLGRKGGNLYNFIIENQIDLMEKIAKMALALLIIIVLTVVIVYATLPYLNYFFGAFILYIVFRSLYHFFVKRARLQNQICSSFSYNYFNICCTDSTVFSSEYNRW